ncbi:MAG: polysaccharide deacetylase family protein [Saprospiraceae bacterium]|nr:polysaccharide deacetylase family protein [Saprospiraceae bacterium]
MKQYFLATLFIFTLISSCQQRIDQPATSAKTSFHFDSSFVWPEGIKAAVSLSFDDARFSQIDTGMAILDSFDVQASFYVSIWSAKQRLDGWKNALKNGHEIGNHSLHHPCTANFDWSREYFLESMDLETMKYEIEEANVQIGDIGLGLPQTFAYPCGQKFVGQGNATASYVPLVAEGFLAGRGWQDEAPNNPMFCDMAQLMGMSSDAKDFNEIKTLLDQVITQGGWLILAGHEIGMQGPQTTRVQMLKELLPYLKDPANAIWVAPIKTIASYISDHRQTKLN